MRYDLSEHLCRQIAFSRATFGPGKRTAGVVDHIRTELVEVEEAGGSPEEWVDVVILALDGLTRSILFADGGCGETDDAAAEAAHMIREKQGINERRSWPDWRTTKADRAIEHQKSEDPQIAGFRAGLIHAAQMCALSPQEVAEDDWGPQGLSMAAMLQGRITTFGARLPLDRLPAPRCECALCVSASAMEAGF